jgi:hypothetical protein
MVNSIKRKFRKVAKPGNIYKYKLTGKFYIVASAGENLYMLINMHTGLAFRKAGPIKSIFAGHRDSFVRQHKGAKFEVVTG